LGKAIFLCYTTFLNIIKEVKAMRKDRLGNDKDSFRKSEKEYRKQLLDAMEEYSPKKIIKKKN